MCILFLKIISYKNLEIEWWTQHLRRFNFVILNKISKACRLTCVNNAYDDNQTSSSINVAIFYVLKYNILPG